MMLCPFCGEEMEKGYLQSGSIMVWVKKKHHFSLLPKDGEVQLDRGYLSSPALPSWICRKCRKVISEYKEKNNFDF